MIDFDTYIRMGEPGGKERAEAWKTAIGLQAVDGLKTSEFFIETIEIQYIVKGYTRLKDVVGLWHC